MVLSPLTTYLRPSAQAQANAWLLSFAGTAAAWDVGRQLYLEPEEEVQYFGANLLFTKVRGEWHGLADEAKASVYTGLLGLLQQLPVAGGGWRKLPPVSYTHLTLPTKA